MATLKCYLVITLILLALIPAAGTVAGEISISTEISSASMAFDARDTLTIRLVWEGEPFLYQIDDFPMPTLEKLEILGSSSSVSTAMDSTISAGERTTRIFRYILQPTDFGAGIVSPLNLTAKNRVTGEARELKTGRLTIEISKPVARSETESGKSALYIIFFAVVIAAGIVTALFIIRRKRGREGETRVDLSYLEALDEIKKETVSDKKRFYSRLYRLLLGYLEKERGLEVSGKTGEEVIEKVNGLDDNAEKANLMQWINLAQKVKYRPEAPSSGDVESTYNAVSQFFENKSHDR